MTERARDGQDGRNGLNGRDGLDGVDGEPGPRGERGEQGKRGPVGETGPIGPMGPTGPIGPQGEPGRDGADGADGRDGLDGAAGADGVAGPVGPKGEAGQTGTRGPQGVRGEQGEIGPMPRHEWDGTRLRFEDEPEVWGDYVDLRGPKGDAGNVRNVGGGGTGPAGPPGAPGAQGAQGDPGPAGPQGDPGADGDDGLSAYQVALANGYVGTEAEWLDSLVGPEGPPGENATVPGSDTEVPFNDGGVFGADPNFRFDKVTKQLLITNEFIQPGTYGDSNADGRLAFGSSVAVGSYDIPTTTFAWQLFHDGVLSFESRYNETTATHSSLIGGNLVWHAGNLLDIGSTASTARTALELGALAVLASINNSNWSGTDLSVANGGTGASTLTGYVKGNGASAFTASASIPNTDVAGLGSLATLSTVNNANWSGTDLAVVNGGTGASDAATARTNLGLPDGTWTPTLTNGANVTSTGSTLWLYIRVGNRVMFSGRLNIDAVAINTDTVVEASLGVASNFSVADNAYGTITTCTGAERAVGYIRANPTTNELILTVSPASTANRAYFVTGMYTVI